MTFQGEKFVVEPVKDGVFDNVDLVLASAGGSHPKNGHPRL